MYFLTLTNHFETIYFVLLLFSGDGGPRRGRLIFLPWLYSHWLHRFRIRLYEYVLHGPQHLAEGLLSLPFSV